MYFTHAYLHSPQLEYPDAANEEPSFLHTHQIAEQEILDHVSGLLLHYYNVLLLFTLKILPTNAVDLESEFWKNYLNRISPLQLQEDYPLGPIKVLMVSQTYWSGCILAKFIDWEVARELLRGTRACWITIEDIPCIVKVEKIWFQGALQHNLSIDVSCLDLGNEERTRASLHKIAVPYCVEHYIPCEIHYVVKPIAWNHFFLRCAPYESRQHLLVHGRLLFDHQVLKCSLPLNGDQVGCPMSSALCTQIELAMVVMIKPLPPHLTQGNIIDFLHKHLGKDNIKSVWFEGKNVREDLGGYHVGSAKVVAINPTAYETILGKGFLAMNHVRESLYPHQNLLRGESLHPQKSWKIGAGDASTEIAHAITREAPSGWQNKLESQIATLQSTIIEQVL